MNTLFLALKIEVIFLKVLLFYLVYLSLFLILSKLLYNKKD